MFKVKIYATNNTTESVKRQPTEWEKVFVNHVSVKEFVYRTLTT